VFEDKYVELLLNWVLQFSVTVAQYFRMSCECSSTVEICSSTCPGYTWLYYEQFAVVI